MGWAESAARLRERQLARFGVDITYLPGGGSALAIAEKAILRQPGIEQAGGVGYFADIEVDPGTARAKKDEVIWVDGTVYVVASVVTPPDMLTRLALCRKTDRV